MAFTGRPDDFSWFFTATKYGKEMEQCFLIKSAERLLVNHIILAATNQTVCWTMFDIRLLRVDTSVLPFPTIHPFTTLSFNH